MTMVVDLILTVVQGVVFVYDIITYPVYKLIQQPWKTSQYRKGVKGKAIMVTQTDQEVSYRRDQTTNNRHYKEIIIDNKVDTMTKAFNYSVSKFGDQFCIGTREVLGQEDEVQNDGKVLKKLSLGEYKWQTYEELFKISNNFGKGLRELGQQPKTRVAIYAETRAEWMMSALGAFSQSIIVSTVYTNLGDEAVCHALEEMEVQIVITSHELLPKFKIMLQSCPTITHIIFMEDQLFSTEMAGYKEGVEIEPFKSVVKMGSNSKLELTPPDAEDTAIIMYTSGSTGVPKGVILTHRNLVATYTCILHLHPSHADDMYIAYLPLAHVLELLSECTMLMIGCKVGYSSPTTMTDMSTKVKKGQKGDAAILKPTLMCCVPLILDRIYKNIIESVDKRGTNFQKFFDFCYRYKLYWIKSGCATPIVDKIVFNKIKALLGGKMRFIITGGAPLSPDTYDFIRVCLGVDLVQGYSLTETCCTGSCMQSDDISTGKAGMPMAGMELKLINWEEGKYMVTDRPNPRGEILISGESIAKGYFKNDEKTEEAFFEENGKKWFKTGDIGEFSIDGTIKIIDRKKDLVKLQLGEYVSLGKVESQLKTHPLVDNVCVYGDSWQSYVVALMVPVKSVLERMAEGLGKMEPDYHKLCKDPEIISAVLKLFQTHGKKSNLEKFEIPTKLTLLPDSWTPESGLVTAAFKIKRKTIQDQFQSCIDYMYHV